MADYKITNDPDRCVKCGLCIAFCPCEVLEADDEGRPFAARIEDCVGCTTCSGNCPQRALLVEATGDATYDPFADEPRAEPIARDLREQYAGMAARRHGEAWFALAARGREPHRQGRTSARRSHAAREPALLPGHDGGAARREHPHAAASAFLPRRHVHLRHDRRAREAGHRRDIRAVPQAGERRGRRPHGGRASHVAAEEPPRHTTCAPLAKTVRVPEVVVFTGTPEQMMWLCMSMSYYTGHRFDFHASGLQLHVRGGGAATP